jgi:hypothetical protein
MEEPEGLAEETDVEGRAAPEAGTAGGRLRGRPLHDPGDACLHGIGTADVDLLDLRGRERLLLGEHVVLDPT